jgi:lipopolysaccharide biosynthesis glycosyltransferase
MKKPKIKILVGYHKPATLLKSDIFTPIHLGRAATYSASKDGVLNDEELSWMRDNMIGDDTGDNISAHNRTLNELTAFYWAWKNLDKLGNPDYIGFMHYRRHLSFADEKLPEDNQMYKSFALDEEYILKCNLNDSCVINKIDGYDMIIKSRHKVYKTPYEHYRHNIEGNTKIKDYDLALSILAQKYPLFMKYAKKYNEGQYAYFTNTVIMKRQLYYQYCEWLFDIIFEAQRQIDTSRYTIQEARACAYISEWLMGIYVTYMRNSENKKILELQGTFIENPIYGVSSQISPAFTHNNIAILLSCEGYDYCLYAAVAIGSLVLQASPNNNYDIIVFADPEAISRVNLFTSIIKDYKNFSIRLVNAFSFVDSRIYNMFHISNHIAKSAYYRLLAPTVLNNYDKVVYLDCDLVIHSDIAKIYNEELGDNAIASVRDMRYHIMFTIDYSHRQYLLHKLEMKNPYNYFNSGVLVMNLKEMRAKKLSRAFFDKLNELKTPWGWDQCVLNCVCERQTKLLDMKWNHQFAIPYQTPNYEIDCPTELVKEYIGNINDHYITHFTDWFKPWIDPSKALAEKFWAYARQTPFYDDIILKNIDKINQNTINDIYWLLHEIYHMDKLVYNKRKYKILYLLSFGRAKKYKNKYAKAKHRLKELRKRFSW